MPLAHRFLSRSFGPELKRVVWTSGAVAGAQLMMGIVGLASARVLGPEDRGIVTAVIAWPTMLSFVALGGLQHAASVRAVSASESGLGRVLGNALLYTVFSGGVASLVALVALPALLSGLGREGSTLVAWSLTLLPGSLLFELLAAVSLASSRVRHYNLARLAGPASLLLAVVVMLVTGTMTAGRLVFFTVMNTYVALGVLAIGLPWRQTGVDGSQLWRDLRFGLGTHPGYLMGLANLRLDVLAMSTLNSATQVGLYSVANTAMTPITALALAAALQTTPAVARVAEGAEGSDTPLMAQVEQVRRSARLNVILATVVGIVLWLVAPLIPTVLGPSFSGAVVLLRVVIPGFVARTYSAVVGAGAIGMRRPAVSNVAEGVALLVTVVLLPFLLPAHGALGAAITSTCAYSLAALTSAWMLFRIARKVSDRSSVTHRVA